MDKKLFQVGQLVKIRKEWQDIGESDTDYLLIDWNEDRGFIVDPACTLPFRPQMLVTLEMIEPKGN